MKTIEERAAEYADRETLYVECGEYTDRTIVEAYAQGATDEYEKLTRWNDPKDILPDKDKSVLVKFVGVSNVNVHYYTVGMLYEDDQWAYENDLAGHRYFKIVGWREIFE